MIQSIFSGEKVYSRSQDAFALYEKSRFGEKKQDRIEYPLIESLFLLKERKMEILSNKKILSEESLFKKIKKADKKAEIKLIVFSDLRKKGYIVKTALKFGAEFRVYEKGVQPGQDHARWILYTTKASDSLDWHEFSAKNRIAHSTKKNLLIALVDEEDSITYYEISWVKP